MIKSKEMLKHPGPGINTDDITNKEQQWNNIGSGTFARTFVQAQRRVTTTRGGPPMSDILRRTVWILSRGCGIDDCVVDDTADELLKRDSDKPDDIRVELVMKDEVGWYTKKRADVA